MERTRWRQWEREEGIEIAGRRAEEGGRGERNCKKKEVIGTREREEKRERERPERVMCEHRRLDMISMECLLTLIHGLRLGDK